MTGAGWEWATAMDVVVDLSADQPQSRGRGSNGLSISGQGAWHQTIPPSHDSKWFISAAASRSGVSIRSARARFGEHCGGTGRRGAAHAFLAAYR